MKTYAIYKDRRKKKAPKIVECDIAERRSLQKGKVVISQPYNNKEELLKGERILEKPCKICDGIVRTNQRNGTPYRNAEKLAKKGICFDCNLWSMVYQSFLNKDPNLLIIERTAWYINPDKENNLFIEGSDPLFIIKKFETNEVIESSNLSLLGNVPNRWSEGVLPKLWGESLKDNAEFIRC